MKPSRFIINSNYATSQNDATGSFTLEIPSRWEVPRVGVPWKTSRYTIGGKSSGMRTIFSSSKYPGVNLVSSSIVIPCTANYYSRDAGGRITINSFLHVNVYRSSPDEARMVLSANRPSDWGGGGSEVMIITDAAQTITCHVSTFLSPFES